MKDFNRNGGQGYNKYKGEREHSSRGEVMHRAVCSDCGNSCEVPFRPNGSKPVYCKDCFGKKKGAYPANNDRGDFTPRAPMMREERPQHAAPRPPMPTPHQPRDSRIDELKAEMGMMHAKLDKIIKSIEATAIPIVKKEEKKVVKAVKKAAAKVVAKAKPAPKKKK